MGSNGWELQDFTIEFGKQSNFPEPELAVADPDAAGAALVVAAGLAVVVADAPDVPADAVVEVEAGVAGEAGVAAGVAGLAGVAAGVAAGVVAGVVVVGVVVLGVVVAGWAGVVLVVGDVVDVDEVGVVEVVVGVVVAGWAGVVLVVDVELAPVVGVLVVDVEVEGDVVLADPVAVVVAVPVRCFLLLCNISFGAL